MKKRPLAFHRNYNKFFSNLAYLFYFRNVLGYKLLAGFIETADHCQKFIRKLESDVFVSEKGLDPIEDFTIDWVFGRLMRLGGVDGEAIEYVNFYFNILSYNFIFKLFSTRL